MKKPISICLALSVFITVFTGCSNKPIEKLPLKNSPITSYNSSQEENSSIADESSSNKDEKTAQNDNTISFVAVGDNIIHETIYQEADSNAGNMNDGKYDFSPMYDKVKGLINGKDIAFINQETVLGGQDLGISGYPAFNSPKEIAQNIKNAGFNLINTASNHSLDKGQEAVDNEIQILKELDGVTFGGTGDSQQTYDTIPVFEKKGVKFAFLAYTYYTNGIAAPNPYTIHYLDDEEIKADVEKAKQISDVIIVSAHWGEENLNTITDTQEHFSQLFADLGVDVVIGTHPHVIQPIKWLEGKDGNKTLIAYSLGNFLGGMLSVDNNLSGMFSFDFVKGKDGISIENIKWTPLVIHFESKNGDIDNDRYNYKIYPLSDYTDELASKHALNGYDGQQVTISHFKEQTENVIDKEFLENQQ